MLQARRQCRPVRSLLTGKILLLKELTAELLARMRFHVTVVGGGLQVVEEVHRTTYDLVVMDGHMPVVDGHASTHEIRADLDPIIATTPIIPLTASWFDGVRQRCFDAGTSHHSSKPAQPEDLELAIWAQLSDRAVAAVKAVTDYAHSHGLIEKITPAKKDEERPGGDM